jgi:glutathionyl-hydroquinone reductase
MKQKPITYEAIEKQFNRVFEQDTRPVQYKLYRAVVAVLSAIACPWCSKSFKRRNLNQLYCSIRCREASRVARWRRMRKRAATRNGSGPSWACMVSLASLVGCG